MEGLDKIPAPLLEKSWTVPEFGGGDRVWPIDLVGQVIESLANQDVAILGGDVWEVLDGRARPTHDSWYCNRNAGETFEAFARRTVPAAREYVEEYGARAGRILLVSLVLKTD